MESLTRCSSSFWWGVKLPENNVSDLFIINSNVKVQSRLTRWGKLLFSVVKSKAMVWCFQLRIRMRSVSLLHWDRFSRLWRGIDIQPTIRKLWFGRCEGIPGLVRRDCLSIGWRRLLWRCKIVEKLSFAQSGGRWLFPAENIFLLTACSWCTNDNISAVTCCPVAGPLLQILWLFEERWSVDDRVVIFAIH